MATSTWDSAGSTSTMAAVPHYNPCNRLPRAATEIQTETTMRAATAAALLAFAGMIIIRLNVLFPYASIQVQPSTPSVPVSEFVRPTNQNPQQVLRAFAGDPFFILGYVIMYIGLHMVTPLPYKTVHSRWPSQCKSGREWIIFVLLRSFPLVGLSGFPFPALG